VGADPLCKLDVGGAAVNEQNNGGPAFPHPGLSDPRFKVRQGDEGMALRDWFAGQAMIGILSGGFADTVPHDDIGGGSDVAFFAYQYADAMLKAREVSRDL